MTDKQESSNPDGFEDKIPVLKDVAQPEILGETKEVNEKESTTSDQPRQVMEVAGQPKYHDEPRRSNFSLNAKDRALLMTAAIQKVTAPLQKNNTSYPTGDYEYESRDMYGYRQPREEYYSELTFSHSKASNVQSDFTFGRRYGDSDTNNSGGLGKRPPEGISPLDYNPSVFDKFESKSSKFNFSQADSRENYYETMVNRPRSSFLVTSEEPKHHGEWDYRNTEERRQRQISKPPMIKEGDWQCADCSNVNWARRMACHMCKKRRPTTEDSNPTSLGPLHDLSDLTCSNCRNIVRPNTTACGLCGTTRLVDPRLNRTAVGHDPFSESRQMRPKKKKPKVAVTTQVFRPNKGYVSRFK